jgi:putative transcriptional regulator
MKNRIREERARLNISQGELAEKVKVSRQTIHSIENGIYVPSTLLALKIARVFEKPVEQIFELEDHE